MPFRSLARRTLAALALLAAPAAARAQFTATVRYVAPATDAAAFNYAVGPVNETLTNMYTQRPGQALGITAFCVDFANGISNNTTYQANVTSLGAVLEGNATLARTRHTGAAGLLGYQKAAFLVDQLLSPSVAALTGSARNQTWGAIQGAIWSIFTPTAVTLDASTSTTNNRVIEFWQQQADDFAASSRLATYDFSRFYIITDVRAAGLASGGVQEFMTASAGLPTVTPEPGTVLLLGVGLAAVGGAAARRRRRGAVGA